MHLAERWDDSVLCQGEVRAADVQSILNEVDLFVLKGKMTVARTDFAFVLGKEVPSQHKVVDEISYDSAGHAHVSAVDAELDVHAPQGFNLASINTYRSTRMRFKFVVVEVGMAAYKVLTDARALAASVA